MILLDHEYHVIELYAYPPELDQWLRETFGPPTGDRWFWKPPKVYFANEADHLMFLLRCT